MNALGVSEAGQVGAGPGSRFGCAGAERRSFPLSRGWFYTNGSSLVERRVLLKQGILTCCLFTAWTANC
ncbi:Pannexin-2 [Manis pentadactyla]|nr:Pannexin-2 [Manis pentadactyla]